MTKGDTGESGVQIISIHTLTRRVTFAFFYNWGRFRHFNPHPHTEGDLKLNRLMAETYISIHTLTRRVTDKYH